METAIEYQTNLDNKPKYLKVPDQIFKEMLLKSLTESENIGQLLDTPEKLQYIRTFVHLLNNICYLKLEEDFWNHYHTVATTECIWSSPLEKEVIKNNNLYRINFKTKAQLERHRQSVLNRLKKAEIELTQHKQQQRELLLMDKLSTILLAFVRQRQSKLIKDFEQRKSLLQFDANDYRLIRTFYEYKPLKDQVRTICFALLV